MSRPLRILIEDGWYHVYHRGTERRPLFLDDKDRRHFIDLLGEVRDRYRFHMHAYCLMDNHYHAIVQTPDANLSDGMQWLHLSYAAWFNARHDRVGALWQGRFGSVPVENSAWAYELSLYVHLNPISTHLLGLGKRSKQAERLGLKASSPEALTLRLKTLREYPWSSYRGYAGYSSEEKWLTTKEILRRACRPVVDRKRTYREDVQNLVRKGGDEQRREKLADSFVIGGEQFRLQLKHMVAGGQRETVGKRELSRRVEFDDVISAVEKAKGESREQFMNRHGDDGPALVMWLSRRYCGMKLREIGAAMGGKDYAAVSDRLRRLDARIGSDKKLMALARTATENLNLET